MLVSALALAGCAGQLQPADTAQPAPGRDNAAIATVQGVTVVARANAWRGFPTDLDRQVTPLLVIVRNDRREPIVVKFDEIALMAPNGRRFAALPPQAIEGSVSAPVSAFPAAVGSFEGFAGPRGGPYGWDTSYEGPVYTSARLPTKDMMALALPAGPIRAGEIAQGFIYFERVGPKGTSLDFVLPLVDAASGESLADAHIPFVFQ